MQQQQQAQQPSHQPQQQQNTHNHTIKNTDDVNSTSLTKMLLHKLMEEIDIEFEEDVKNHIIQKCDQFVDDLMRTACEFAKHRKSNIVEAKDVQLYLERNLNKWLPGFDTEE